MNNLFGTDGIRGTIGSSLFSAESIKHLGNAIARWAVEKYGEGCTILLGHDTRISCSYVKASLESSMLLFPLKIYDAMILPTPALYALTKNDQRFSCAMVISASHNPYQDNGIKIIDAIQGKISLDDELIISNYYDTTSSYVTTYNALGSTLYWPEARILYTRYLTSFFNPLFLENKKIVLDCAHGALSHLAPDIFRACGATTIIINDNPNGTNINHQCGALAPQMLQKMVLMHNADAGFAFDGDGDRVIAINRMGHIKDGDDILALLLDHPQYAPTSMIVGTDMTNYGFEAQLKKQNKILRRTRVGDKYVAQQLQADNLLLGGEQSGHIIMRDYLETGDSIFTALRILEAVIHTHNWDMITFDKYPQMTFNVPITLKKDLTLSPCKEIIAHAEQLLHKGRIIVRYSGTENVLRIMVEDDELQHVNALGSYLTQELGKELVTQKGYVHEQSALQLCT